MRVITEGKMIVKEIVIQNPTGLQSKSAAIFIQKASNYKSSIWIVKEERKANGKSLLGVLSLGIGKGAAVTLTTEGPDETAAAGELEKYLLSDTSETD
jgi:phosphotransferase system HPr (HPr) family protein